MRRNLALLLVGSFVAGGSVSAVAGTAVHAATAPTVVINELHYNPADGNPAGEFVELLNVSGQAVDVSGWCFNGITHCFPTGSIIGPAAFFTLTPAQYSGALSNGGERIRLRDNSDKVVDQVEYADAGLWPAMADGEGDSLQRRVATADGNNPGNWVSAPPTPNAPNALEGGVLPVFSDVDHTVLPAPGEEIAVTAKLADGVFAVLTYRIGFGPEVSVPMTVTGGVASASIPGQAAGSLVRYRLAAQSAEGVIGAWPRQGDGATYTGTTVASGTSSKLPVFGWFIEDSVYDTAFHDLTLTGDDGYPLVVTFGGEIFDNSKIRVKGQVSRNQPKKKWKVVLAPGHVLDIPDILPEPVDEFALHSSWSDKSFLRETLAAEMMTAAGVAVSQSFPVRVERNGAFYGLFTYIEQPDGTWRDRFGFDDSIVYEVGANTQFGSLDPGDASLSESRLRYKYDKETQEYDPSDDQLRTLIGVLNGLSGAAEREWIYANVDVPSVVNLLAASAVIQHQDIGQKNYRLILDEHGKWSTVPNDFDLTLGRRWSVQTGALSDIVGIQGAFEHPGGPLFAPFWFDPELAAMVQRRIRTLTEQLLAPEAVAARVEQLNNHVEDEAALDRAVWGTYGSQQTARAAGGQIVSNYVIPQYNRLLGSFAASGRVARNPQPAVPAVSIAEVSYPSPTNEYIVLRNNSTDSVDLSLFTIEALDLVIPGGTVLLPGRTAVFVGDSWGSLANAFANTTTGTYPGSLADDNILTLRNPAGDIVAKYNAIAPGSLSEITGTPNRSAVVSLIATETGGPGFLQILDCAATPGATSNLNADGVGQTVSALAVIRFDADGKACVFNQSATHIVVDLQSYVADAAIDDVGDTRLLDTRSGAKPAAGSMTLITGIPNRSAIVSLVATESTAPGYLQVLGCDAAPGQTSNLNVDRADQTIAGLAVIRLDANGQACVYNLNPTHIVVDLQAYLTDAAIDEVPDVRVLDTRGGVRPANGAMTKITGLAGRSAVVSLIATETAGAGYLQVLPCSATPGHTSNLNVDHAGQTVSGLAVIRFDGNGETCVYDQTATHIVVDLQGYLTEVAIQDLDDIRLIDTRDR